MAITTQAKRQGALGEHSPIALLPFPDGTAGIDADDRWILLGLYPLSADVGSAVGRWAQNALRRRLWVRPVRANATPIVEPGQGEDST